MKPEGNIDPSPDALQGYSDAELLAIVRQRLPPDKDSRLRELAARADKARLSAEAVNEMEQLIDLVDHQMLLRSEALLLLKQRGCDILLIMQEANS